MNQGVIISGFGGQGILSAGKLLAYAGMLEDKFVTWLPSYGPEMRGGTANCHVKISSKPISSPVLNKVYTLIAMNEPSLKKFEDLVIEGGVIISDTSIINNIDNKIEGIEYIGIPATKIASDMGNKAFANIILLGKLIKKTALVSKENIVDAFKEVLPQKLHKLIPKEIKALEIGMDY